MIYVKNIEFFRYLPSVRVGCCQAERYLIYVVVLIRVKTFFFPSKGESCGCLNFRLCSPDNISPVIPVIFERSRYSGFSIEKEKSGIVKSIIKLVAR